MAKWSAYGPLADGTLADDDTLLVRDISDTTLAATGTQKEYTGAGIKTTLALQGTKTATAANDFTAGKVGFLAAAGTMTLANADAEATTKGLLGMASEAILGEASGVFVLYGFVTVTGHGYTGPELFLSDTADGEMEDDPSNLTVGNYMRFIGYVWDANTILFCPSSTWGEVQE